MQCTFEERKKERKREENQIEIHIGCTCETLQSVSCHASGVWPDLARRSSLALLARRSSVSWPLRRWTMLQKVRAAAPTFSRSHNESVGAEATPDLLC